MGETELQSYFGWTFRQQAAFMPQEKWNGRKLAGVKYGMRGVNCF